MAIKILRHGTKFTKECEYCGCLFSFEESDFKRYQWEESYRIDPTIRCPDCKQLLLLTIKDIGA